ncbi:MAG TPA: response regulator [Pyrinomonadaceae bacterium]|nr:response regulator [Pyrinomonadaceae bacterium]
MSTLLIVDDDTGIREVLQELFSDSHECHTADRAEQALAYLELETYDTVITDIAMPGLSGEEILKQVLEKSPTTPVIVISGVADQLMSKKLLAMGAFAYFTKPYELEALEEAVVRAIAHRRELLNSTQREENRLDEV